MQANIVVSGIKRIRVRPTGRPCCGIKNKPKLFCLPKTKRKKSSIEELNSFENSENSIRICNRT